MAFGDLLRRRIVAKLGSRLSDAAQKLGIERTTLGRFQSGELIPRADVYLYLCAKLGIDPRHGLYGKAGRPSTKRQSASHSANRAVRIYAEPLDGADEEPMTIDAIIGADARIVGKQALFGLWGRFDHPQDHYSPFVLASDGRVIYDSEYSTEERYWTCDLRDGEIKAGRIFCYSCDSDSNSKFRIVSVTEMPVLEHK